MRRAVALSFREAQLALEGGDSPGTMTADVDPDSTTIYVHFLFLHDVNAARASLDRLERLASQAIIPRDPGHRTAGLLRKESP